jgi:Tfp pilus assembly protein PilF
MHGAHCYLGNLLLGTGQPREAKGAFERAVSLEPRNGFFWGNLAYARQELGELTEAEQCFRKGLSLEVDSPYLHTGYGLFLKHTGRPAKAKRYRTRALALDPTDTKASAALTSLSSA